MLRILETAVCLMMVHLEKKRVAECMKSNMRYQHLPDKCTLLVVNEHQNKVIN
jgi:hypothetical protein